jgi:hypothetical protein
VRLPGATHLFNVLYRLEPHKMVAEGFEWGESGVRSFAETYGVLERITIITPEENACSKAKVTKQVKRKPGASPLLFGKFLMELGAFVSLEDISSELPAYREEVIGVDMDQTLAKAYADLEEQIKEALEEHRGNHSVISTALNALLSYPDRPYGLGDLIGSEYNPEAHRRMPFLIARTQDLPEGSRYAKERKLIECIKADLARGRKCQIYAVYTAKRDVTGRLERILSQEGVRVSVLTSQVPPDQREAWYERRLRDGMQVCVAHPRLVSVGMDYVEYEGGRELFFLKPVCFGSEINSSEDTGLERLRVRRITVASRMSRQPFRARAAVRTRAAIASIWPRGNEKAASNIFSANALRNLRSPWRITREYASQAYAKSSRWQNSISTNRSCPLRTCNP